MIEEADALEDCLRHERGDFPRSEVIKKAESLLSSLSGEVEVKNG
jgi:hypothetical protein